MALVGMCGEQLRRARACGRRHSRKSVRSPTSAGEAATWPSVRRVCVILRTPVRAHLLRVELGPRLTNDLSRFSSVRRSEQHAVPARRALQADVRPQPHNLPLQAAAPDAPCTTARHPACGKSFDLAHRREPGAEDQEPDGPALREDTTGFTLTGLNLKARDPTTDRRRDTGQPPSAERVGRPTAAHVRRLLTAQPDRAGEA